MKEDWNYTKQFIIRYLKWLQGEGKYCETGKVAQWLSEFENVEL